MDEQDGSEIYEIRESKPTLTTVQLLGMIDEARSSKELVFEIHPENFTAEDILEMQGCFARMYDLHIHFCEGMLKVNRLSADNDCLLKRKADLLERVNKQLEQRIAFLESYIGLNEGVVQELKPLPEKYQ